MLPLLPRRSSLGRAKRHFLAILSFLLLPHRHSEMMSLPQQVQQVGLEWWSIRLTMIPIFCCSSREGTTRATESQYLSREDIVRGRVQAICSWSGPSRRPPTMRNAMIPAGIPDSLEIHQNRRTQNRWEFRTTTTTTTSRTIPPTASHRRVPPLLASRDPRTAFWRRTRAPQREPWSPTRGVTSCTLSRSIARQPEQELRLTSIISRENAATQRVSCSKTRGTETTNGP